MNKILETTKYVVKHSDFVQINRERLAEFSNGFEHGTTKHWLGAAPFHLSHFDDEEKLHFITIFNLIIPRSLLRGSTT